MSAASNVCVKGIRNQTKGLGEVDVSSSKLWGAQTPRSLKRFSIEQDLISREMIAVYATLEKAAASAPHAAHRVDHAIICTDHIGRLDGDTVDDIMKTHPMIIIGGVLQQNPFLIPPIKFLREFRERRAGRKCSTSTGS
jgi:fumarate hydratase class II